MYLFGAIEMAPKHGSVRGRALGVAVDVLEHHELADVPDLDADY